MSEKVTFCQWWTSIVFRDQQYQAAWQQRADEDS
jgi:hypothetical protein